VSSSSPIENDKLKQEIMRDEGVRYKPYTCSAGRITIGIGHNLEDVGVPPHIVDALYEWDVAQVCKELSERIPWWVDLDAVRQRALINMAFNLGVPRLMLFKNMLSALKNKDYDKAAEHALDSKWAQQVGSRAHRMSHMIRTGQAPL
jgi:lysozyme